MTDNPAGDEIDRVLANICESLSRHAAILTGLTPAIQSLVRRDEFQAVVDLTGETLQNYAGLLDEFTTKIRGVALVTIELTNVIVDYAEVDRKRLFEKIAKTCIDSKDLDFVGEILGVQTGDVVLN